MLERLRYRPDGTLIPFPTHLFFLITLLFGLAFVSPPSFFHIGAVELFKFSSLHGLAVYWGIALLVTSALNTIALLTRNKLITSIVGTLGFACWLYAGLAYVIMHIWFGLLVAALPNAAFWAWYSY